MVRAIITPPQSSPIHRTPLLLYPQTPHLTNTPLKTKISSKYTVLKPTPSKIQKRQAHASKQAQKSGATPSEPTPSADDPSTYEPTFKLKTYDPVSGVCLKYKTDKAAEVGRLIGNLGRLGRHMAALPETTEDLSAPAEGGSGIGTPVVEKDVVMGGTEKVGVPPAAGGGGGKKKKKGKK